MNTSGIHHLEVFAFCGVERDGRGGKKVEESKYEMPVSPEGMSEASAYRDRPA